MEEEKKKRKRKVRKGKGETKVERKTRRKKENIALDVKAALRACKKKKILELTRSEPNILGAGRRRLTVKNLQLSIRLKTGVTSLTVKSNIVALFILFTVKGSNGTEDHERIKSIVTQFVHKCLEKWEEIDGKGLTEFVADRMVQEILDKQDFRIYQNLVGTLQD